MTQMTMKIRSRQRAVPMALSFSSWLGRPAIHTLRDVDKDVNARREAEHHIGPRHAVTTAAVRGGLAAIFLRRRHQHQPADDLAVLELVERIVDGSQRARTDREIGGALATHEIEQLAYFGEAADIRALNAHGAQRQERRR